jgi:hypothetical protein
VLVLLLLQIDRLRAPGDRPGSAHAAAAGRDDGRAPSMPALLAAAAALGTGGAGYGDQEAGDGDGDGGSEEGGSEEEDEDEGLDEGGILQLMEIFALSRAAAVELLLAHGGNVDAAISELLGGG